MDGNFQLIPLGSIEPSRSNPRKHFDPDALHDLAVSIKAKGVLQPILVRPLLSSVARNKAEQGVAEAFGIAGPPRWQLVAGERRFRAAKLAKLTEIPAVIRELTDREVLEVQVVENEQRADVTPLEKAEGYGRLIDEHDQSAEDVAAKVGKSVATIRGLVKLRSLPDKAKAALDAGELTVAVAQLVARIPGGKARQEATAEALRKDYSGDRPSYREMKETIQHRWMIELKQAPFSQTDKDLVPGLPTCKACPKRAGNNRDLYPDTRADVCTDPECYGRKVTMHRGRMYQQARAEGVRLLDGDETETALRMGVGQYGRSKWVDLTEEWIIDGNRKTVAAWLNRGEKAGAAFCCGEDGKPRYLALRAEMEEAAESKSKTGAEKRKAREDRKAGNRPPSDWEVEKLARVLAVGEVAEMARANFDSLAGLDANGGPDTDAAYQALWIIAQERAMQELYDGSLDDRSVIGRFVPGVLDDGEADPPSLDEQLKLVGEWAEKAGPVDLLAYLLAHSAAEILGPYSESKALAGPLLSNFTDGGSEKAIKAAALKQLKAERAAKAKPSANGHAKKPAGRKAVPA